MTKAEGAPVTDGHHVWEMEAKTDKEMCKPQEKHESPHRRSTLETCGSLSHDSKWENSLLVEIPPFRNQRITSPVQVNFYVCNGKRKRSQYQLFTYLPANGNKTNSLSLLAS
ncbi:hypothetical protein EK904_006343 [Melospiza melodia maxima]|nr:hypothetical protein EK904_006343 [Melospiza melodia maxima]